jgi:hypothetical protein
VEGNLMTTVIPSTVECALCGATNEITTLLSTNHCGVPDLDLRPPPMARDTLGNVMFRCRNCGYASSDLSSVDEGDQALVQGAEYQRILKEPLPDLAKSYACAAFLDEVKGHVERAGALYLRVAWVCDDENEVELAREFRRRCAAHLESVIVSRPDAASEAIVTAKLVLVDVLRRAGMFEEAMGHCEELLQQELDEGSRRVARYQTSLIRTRDDACHQIPSKPSTSEVVANAIRPKRRQADVDLPPQSDVQAALLALLAKEGGRLSLFGVRAELIERVLAQHFGLRVLVREYTEARYGSSPRKDTWRAWIIFAAKKCAGEGLIEVESSNQWRLTEQGWEAARSFKGGLRDPVARLSAR